MKYGRTSPICAAGESAEQMQSYTMKTVITAVVVGAFWFGFKTILGK
jgi:hypothetical protein